MVRQSALEGLKVLELSGMSGAYCGKLFAGLGAQVTLVEPPQGSPLRARAPMAKIGDGAPQSLWFGYLAADKQSVVLDLGTPEGQRALVRMAGEVELLILGDHPDAHTVDVDALHAAYPGLTIAVITPYGRTGPYAGYRGDDLTLMAMGGLLTLAGQPDRAPVVAHGEQGLLAADQFAAVASLAAVLAAESSGKGELIDLSIQESIVMALENAAQTYQLEGKIRQRSAGMTRAGTGIYPCKDGDIYLLAGGIGETAMWGNFAAWLRDDGVPDADLFASSNWNDNAPGAREAFDAIFLPYAAIRTKDQLYGKGKQWSVPIAPMSTPADLLVNRQLAYREFFTAPAHAPASHPRMPGAPYKLSQTPWQLEQAAPAAGGGGIEHRGALRGLRLAHLRGNQTAGEDRNMQAQPEIGGTQGTARPNATKAHVITIATTHRHRGRAAGAGFLYPRTGRIGGAQALLIQRVGCQGIGARLFQRGWHRAQRGRRRQGSRILPYHRAIVCRSGIERCLRGGQGRPRAGTLRLKLGDIGAGGLAQAIARLRLCHLVIEQGDIRLADIHGLLVIQQFGIDADHLREQRRLGVA